MNLQPINPAKPEFFFSCAGCGQTTPSITGCADLDGEPFRAYYCAGCTANLTRSRINRGQQPLNLD